MQFATLAAEAYRQNSTFCAPRVKAESLSSRFVKYDDVGIIRPKAFQMSIA